MARASRSGGKTIAAKRKARSVKGRNLAKTKRSAPPTAIRLKRSTVSALGKELKEAREQQEATAEILKVIASSPDDVQPVFEAIATSANRLIGGFSSTVILSIDGVAHLKALTSTTPEGDEILKSVFPRRAADFPPLQNARIGEIEQIADTEVMPNELRDLARARGYRSVVFAPLVNRGTLIGLIGVTRVQPGNFSDHHLQLLRTFADQAVIAIENVRLFDEVQAKARDLTEALTYQTGSANILKVIASSPTNVEPVLQSIVESACELCDATDAVVLLKDGDNLRFSAHHGPIGVNVEKWPISRHWVAGRAFLDQKPIHLHDIFSDENLDFSASRELSRRTGSRTMNIHSILAVPLLREKESIGSILLRRTEVRPFDEKQISLLQTFADQAVIAIGNVRLFEEVQARTRDLAESLQQQTATSEVLQIISSSPSDLAPLFEKMLVNATRVCGAEFGG